MKWEVLPQGIAVRTIGDNILVCDLEKDEDNERRITNARLIAAAPELLLAAKEAAIMLKEIADVHTPYIDIDKSPGFINLMAAISKAEDK